MILSDLLNKVIIIAETAGEQILEVYQRSGSIAVGHKADNSPITEADQRAHRYIVDALTMLDAELPVLSEESGPDKFEQRRNWTRYWLVDPLDGTKEFISRNGEFTVNIALIENGKAMLGVVHVPVTGVTYSGIVGQGAYRHSGGQRSMIQVRVMKSGETTLYVVASRNHRGEKVDAMLGKLNSVYEKVVLSTMGSSLKICLVAEGKADIYPRLAPTSEWDTAAAHAVLTAAGGVLVDITGKELVYNQGRDLLNPFFVALADRHFPLQDYL